MQVSKSTVVVAAIVAATMFGVAGGAEAATVNQQCGQQYQAAKAAGTLNGLTWNQFRSDCAAKLKAEPASATTSAPATATNPLNPAPVTPSPASTPQPTAPAPATTTAAAPASPAPTTGGRTAFVARERACGAEWRANKVTLVAQTPGIDWHKYWHECNTRMKAAGK